MTTESENPEITEPQALSRMAQNLKKVEELSKRLTRVMSQREGHQPALDGPNQQLFAKAAQSYWAEAMTNPARLMEHQMGYWTKSVAHFVEAQQALAKGGLAPVEGEAPTDKRFANPLWQTHPYFNFIKQQYLINAEALRQAVEDAQDMDPAEKKRLVYFSQQIIAMMSPTNFLATNPDVLERAVETEGESLVKGLENLIADLEANNGELVVKLADDSAFELGRNIATTPGKVVFRNRMFELIQYTPSTEEVHKTPLLIFPPWINKFYILDLKAQNSLVKWLVDQGHTLFVVSWVNPDVSYAQIGMEDYVEEGYLAAIEEVKAITDEKRVNVVGYCIAGTTLALTLSLLKKRSDTSIKSATFFTALTDFSDQGEFQPFLTNDFIDGIEAETADKGILPSVVMARTFSFLRSNDLVYGPAVRSYMMGETPPAFDLLYWNGDGANLPGQMAMQYLRGLCQRNELAEGGYKLLGERLTLDDIEVPLCAVACETDHIAPWKDCYRGVQQMGSKDKTFIMAQSGHIAGIVNPPSRNKYGHYVNGDLSQDYAAWREAATYHEGSWWPRWGKWLVKRAGTMIPARFPGDDGREVLGDAPGAYVARKAND
ncbi:class I poly(R)-hydroxyalkanoic acid synthase [Sulfitobacter sp. HI0082]|jgi:polyhydroxyalkanoate synthase|uniref:PHA/PHB synthase family protein n=1 Tax=unclassified Sulfitobacter TaxID=196795 RepID=UPI0007C3DEA0|nr:MULTISPECIES: class I poly(R)-hydroxyalkanoic acid synthase [unclassified Sulfitobacter]KZZ28487.1 class I poly(R)-hydroxyalkanoic acid synthase [Sulfitobacter sp. HI0082]KZX99588.1 class I poly(R)-hydroxyalkanoic acid synthase [Sulfitobacter sp. HI0021]KZY04324.1 class I poly(R)-hydroxyalkanoic acid synthase [Sulfitobacter sp. HI0027]KZZ03221.1 class I poly(R)-hydroxyalkanoic acid synthase [Sulfitobacter sp. HI0076]MAP16079.1 class I poly(R)-hydroxyalkanoic acid synthase [Sulfitobacter sp.|tara:strand:- start:1531 stop:3336 length:1806 start_codon:yes stop_codon:yes gene_type:complete